jgi:hypothetical protein
MYHRILATLVGCALSLLAGSTVAQTTDPIMALGGRWAGMASVTPDSGPDQAYSCVGTYFPADNGARLTQNLRCKSDSYQLDASTQLQIAGTKITGRWQDKVNNLDGIINGTVKPDGFDILLSGDFFDAKMTIARTSCQQSITIEFEGGLPVKRVSAVLKKC